MGSHTSWYEKLDGRIAQAFMSIQAVKAVELGTGVENAGRPGSQVHDEIYYEDAAYVRKTNRAGVRPTRKYQPALPLTPEMPFGSLFP